MAINESDLVNAGIVAHLCYYFDSLGGKETDWATVREYAVREWRDASYETILSVIDRCKKAAAMAAK